MNKLVLLILLFLISCSKDDTLNPTQPTTYTNNGSRADAGAALGTSLRSAPSYNTGLTSIFEKFSASRNFSKTASALLPLPASLKNRLNLFEKIESNECKY